MSTHFHKYKFYKTPVHMFDQVPCLNKWGFNFSSWYIDFLLPFLFLSNSSKFLLLFSKFCLCQWPSEKLFDANAFEVEIQKKTVITKYTFIRLIFIILSWSIINLYKCRQEKSGKYRCPASLLQNLPYFHSTPPFQIFDTTLIYPTSCLVEYLCAFPELLGWWHWKLKWISTKPICTCCMSASFYVGLMQLELLILIVQVVFCVVGRHVLLENNV